MQLVPPSSAFSSYASTHATSTSSPSSSSSTLLSPIPTVGTSSIPPSSSILSEDLPMTLGWDSNNYILPSSTSIQPSLLSSAAPGPVQRPQSSFSPAPGTINNTTSRCIQRPSPDSRSSSISNASYSTYFPINYTGNPTTSGWSEPTIPNTHESQWSYAQDEQQQFGLSSNSNDFPLYDPFHSGAGLTIPSSSQSQFLTNGFSGKYLQLYFNKNQ